MERIGDQYLNGKEDCPNGTRQTLGGQGKQHLWPLIEEQNRNIGDVLECRTECGVSLIRGTDGTWRVHTVVHKTIEEVPGIEDL